MSESAINFVPLDADRSRVQEHLNDCINEAMQCMNEQEVGNRKRGPIKAKITVTFTPTDGGCVVDTQSEVKAPPRVAEKGIFAQVSRGKLVVADAEQPDMFPRKLRDASEKE